MMERILEQQQPVSTTLTQLQKGDLMPTDIEITTMYDFTQFMKPSVQMTEAIGGENWANISFDLSFIKSPTKSYLVLKMILHW